MGHSADITERKKEILGLLERLHRGEQSEEKTKKERPLRDKQGDGRAWRDRIQSRRQDLMDLRERREKLGQDLLEERLLSICQMLDERISKIEAAMQQGTLKRAPERRAEPEPAPETGNGLDNMGPDLDVAIPGFEQSFAEPGSEGGEEQFLTGANELAPSLSGQISDGLLADVIQMLSANTKSGTFRLEGDGNRISLFFLDGEMYHAEADDMTGQTAFFAAMALEDGAFAFSETDPLPEEKTIDGNTQFMILEALRQIDEERGGQ